MLCRQGLGRQALCVFPPFIVGQRADLPTPVALFGNLKPGAFMTVFTQAYRQSHIPATISSGFAKTGISPFDPTVISKEDLEGGDLMTLTRPVDTFFAHSATGTVLGEMLRACTAAELEESEFGDVVKCCTDCFARASEDDEVKEGGDAEVRMLLSPYSLLY